MPTPEFIVRLREHIGHAELWLPGVSGVVIRGEHVLLVQRRDNLEWTPITGICEPGEQPDTAIRRECREETGVTVRVTRLLWVRAVGPITHANGDRASYMDTAFLCEPISGTAHVADDESADVRWFPLDDLPTMQHRFRELINHARIDAPAGWGVHTTHN
ncbi:NUDIX domain-containing protein [Corynebacterium sp.]|uniref:NUDIX hydrolase n=1 Tax=Corynebacterium sp. TaxID=1720 RepID=UPI0026DD9967|nr:NUDIX domain-containing protein [Corynebacterium sp.]MDO5077604.1 NUDIX domain-containing protein [Corynebacterium sp.]